MYFILYVTDVFTMTNFSSHPQTFNSVKFEKLNRFSKAPRDNFKFGVNLSYFSLFLTDNLTKTNFLHYPPIFKWASLTSNMFSEAPCGQIKKVITKESYDLRW